MRHFRLLPLLAAAWLSGCDVSPEAAGEGAEARMRASVTSIFEEGWSEGEVDVFAGTLGDTVLFHYAGSPRQMSRDEMTDAVLRWRSAFPDLRMEVEELVVGEDLAAVRLTLTGTHRGPWAGAEPSGERVQMALMMFLRFEDGVVVELWESDDQLGLRRQLGIL